MASDLDTDIQFYTHPQSTALTTFIPLLRRHLPHSNPLYYRLLAPQNHPSRGCVIAATFPPSTCSATTTTTTSTPTASPTPTYTVLFADLLRADEPQIWLFNPLTTLSFPSTSDTALLNLHAKAIISFLKSHAPPTTPKLFFGCIDSRLAQPIISLASPFNAVPRCTTWNLFTIRTAELANSSESQPASLPEGLTFGRVPASQLPLVISTSTVPRTASTLLSLPNTCLLTPSGSLVVWSYLGIDGSLGTLYTQPEYRGRGLASLVARELLTRLRMGEFEDLGFSGESGWVHASVKEGNVASEGVMRRLGAERTGVSYYFLVDGPKVEI